MLALILYISSIKYSNGSQVEISIKSYFNIFVANKVAIFDENGNLSL